MDILSMSTPEEVKEIAEKASEISQEASKQAEASMHRHELQAEEYARKKLIDQSRFIKRR